MTRLVRSNPRKSNTIPYFFVMKKELIEQQLQLVHVGGRRSDPHPSPSLRSSCIITKSVNFSTAKRKGKAVFQNKEIIKMFSVTFN